MWSEGSSEHEVVAGLELEGGRTRGEKGCGLATVAHAMRSQLVQTRRQLQLQRSYMRALSMPLFNWAHLHHTRSAGKALAVLLKGQAELAFDSEHVQLSACGWLPVTPPVVASHR